MVTIAQSTTSTLFRYFLSDNQTQSKIEINSNLTLIFFHYIYLLVSVSWSDFSKKKTAYVAAVQPIYPSEQLNNLHAFELV